MRYDVHLYVTVRVKVSDIEAGSQVEAIKLADEMFGKDAVAMVSTGEYADEVLGALVDEQGDEEYDRTTYYRCTASGWEVEDL